MSQSWQLQFRAVITGLVLADRVGAEPRLFGLPTAFRPAPKSGNLWRQLFVQTAQTVSRGQWPDWHDQSLEGALRALEAEAPLLLSLSALPLMLLNLDGPGQGRAALADWSQRQGLQPQTQVLMLAVFQVLQGGLGGGALAGSQEASPRKIDSPETANPNLAWLMVPAQSQPLELVRGEPSAAWHSLARTLTMTRQAQGQYELALRLALSLVREQSHAAWEVPFVGLWAAVAGGLPGIPLGWRLRGLYDSQHQTSCQVDWCQGWSTAQETALWDLADALFNRWVGVCPSLISSASSVYPVGQVSSRLNRAN